MHLIIDDLSAFQCLASSADSQLRCNYASDILRLGTLYIMAFHNVVHISAMDLCHNCTIYIDATDYILLH